MTPSTYQNKRKFTAQRRRSGTLKVLRQELCIGGFSKLQGIEGHVRTCKFFLRPSRLAVYVAKHGLLGVLWTSVKSLEL